LRKKARFCVQCGHPIDDASPPASENAPPQPRAPIINRIGMALVRVEAGSFVMGSPMGEPGRSELELQQSVTFTRPFLIATTPVTQSQWKQIMGTSPSQLKGDGLPVNLVSWQDAVQFCHKLGQQEGARYALPTEAQWEYACRAGTTGAYGGSGLLNEMGWCADTSGEQLIDSQQMWDLDSYESRQLERLAANRCRINPVARKKPNAWGLYDMHGNVWEWCADSRLPQTAARRDEASFHRMLRGGAWNCTPRRCRSASRDSFAAGARNISVGFRVCREL
jgi:formylglycine-generating enzyme required for sulfatase activity